MAITKKRLRKLPPLVLPRKRCENCGTFFQQNKPWQKFCKDACRRQFNENGTAWGKLKILLTNHMEKDIARMRRELAREFVRREEIGGDEGAAIVRRALERKRAKATAGTG